MSSKKTSEVGKKLREGVAARIKELRGDVNQKNFARLVGISQQKLSTFETAGLLPSLPTLVKIAQRTRASLDWLLTGEGPMILEEQQEPRGRPKIYQIVEPISGKAVFVSEEHMKHVNMLLDIFDSEDRGLIDAISKNLEQFQRFCAIINPHFRDIIILEHRVHVKAIEHHDRRKTAVG